jgi:two-component system phosphate regulon sensor histidine kinase PhoR
MKWNHTNLLIAAAALAILGLIGIQVRWMQHSRKLLEEQFNNRVSMALCQTVENMAANPASTSEVKACCSGMAGGRCDKSLAEMSQMPEMSAALTQALSFYKVDLPKRVLITKKDGSPNAVEAQPFSCSLTPVLANDSLVLQLLFNDKEDYISSKMGVMAGVSLALLALICLIFGIASFYFLRQKKMSALNRDFFNHMTHEFRTPLTNIQLAGNMLVRKNPELADNRYVSIIQHECRQLTEQVENVLYLAGLEKGDYRLKKETVHLDKVLKNTLEQMDIQIREKGADVQILPILGDPVIQADVFHIGNAFRNLIDNALKYSDVSPVLRIEVLPAAAGWTVRFSDKGIGLSEQECSRIFEKFKRSDAPQHSNAKGFGLGLTYVKKITELHGGRIEAHSIQGQGARFDLYFPT